MRKVYVKSIQGNPRKKVMLKNVLNYQIDIALGSTLLREIDKGLGRTSPQKMNVSGTGWKAGATRYIETRNDVRKTIGDYGKLQEEKNSITDIFLKAGVLEWT